MFWGSISSVAFACSVIFLDSVDQVYGVVLLLIFATMVLGHLVHNRVRRTVDDAGHAALAEGGIDQLVGVVVRRLEAIDRTDLVADLAADAAILDDPQFQVGRPEEELGVAALPVGRVAREGRAQPLRERPRACPLP